MGRALSVSERNVKKRALLAVFEAAARNGQTCPTLDQLGKLTRTSGSTIATLIDDLRREKAIRYWIKTKAMIGQYRVVEVTATGLRTATPERRKVPPPGAAKRLANLEMDTRRDIDARDHEIYGAMLPDVKFLRHRGWVITKENAGFRVGNALVPAEEIVAKAARERRLMNINA